MVKTLTNATLQSVLLLIVLSLYAWSLVKDLATLEQWRKAQAALARDDVAYGESSGVSVVGTAIHAPALSRGTDMVFVLRHKSLQNDLSFWQQVKAAMGAEKLVGLVGYCDSQLCVEDVRTMAPPPFPVLAYGEAASIQAVMDADVHGLALVIKGAVGRSVSRIHWRKPGTTPQAVVQEALR